MIPSKEDTTLPIGSVVKKISGKPFKSGRKTARVWGVISREFPKQKNKNGETTEVVERLCYVFSDEAEDYFVSAGQCELVAS